MKTKRFTVLDCASIGLFAALMVVCAQINIPLIGGVPVTLQTFAVALAGVVLGPRNGAFAVLVYLLLGAAGAPVFHGFAGGLGMLFGVTGGFLLSFPALALGAGFGERLRERRGLWLWLALGLLCGMLVNYLCGMLYFSVYLQKSLWTAFTACVLPFLLPDAAKFALAGLLGTRLKRILRKSRILRPNEG
jgi:biotin transport system substrate-specific component